MNLADGSRPYDGHEMTGQLEYLSKCISESSNEFTDEEVLLLVSLFAKEAQTSHVPYEGFKRQRL
eukprot:CAMPEP_0203769578 /NCGR_PEP_ID=MMETSP0099_2-20121227/2284_1 /ASSEMBLY_ACC=CAM_ASM_000209 /TAXON_ID=96639 /ORGANISM=" , Strain NY0313808BC1" /LENGTH=64 /DNA_ID=CAMNT_0050666521 /DNA_START=187 /DNA_END=381 /DNA_ORIENTATION=-